MAQRLLLSQPRMTGTRFQCTREAIERPPRPGWRARLTLAYARERGGTALVRKTHSGPLAVQKSLYPEGPAVCHTLILHPPGGMVGRDALEIEAALDPGTHVLITMPGASKWYRSTGGAASQSVAISVGAGATLEWLPPETIVFNGADARLSMAIRIAGGGNYMGWEILCLGRTAAGEKFDAGTIHQTTEIVVDGERVWDERCRLGGGSPLLDSAAGLAGAPVSAVMLAAGANVPAGLLAQCRTVRVEAPARCGISAMPQLLVARYAGHSGEEAKNYFVAIWRTLRPLFAGRAAVAPRIWST